MLITEDRKEAEMQNIISHLLNFKHLWLNSDSIPGNTFQGHGCSGYGKFSLYYNWGFWINHFIIAGSLATCVSQKRRKEERGVKE